MTMADPYTPEKSKALFGNSHMSAVMLEIASLDDETFSPKQIIERTGLLGSVVHPLIHRLADADQIEYLGRGPDGKAKLYRVRPTHIWDAMKKYADGVADGVGEIAS
jgi:DNA-binding MarR family transcriptional regulator